MDAKKKKKRRMKKSRLWNINKAKAYKNFSVPRGEN